MEFLFLAPEQFAVDGTLDRLRRARPSLFVPFEVGAPVMHEAFGAGTVAGYEGDKVVVLFEDGGYRTLLAEHVVREGLLRATDG